MAANFKTSDQIVKSVNPWKAEPQPKLTKMEKGLKEELETQYKEYKKQFETDKKQIKGLLEGLFKEVSKHNPVPKERPSWAKMRWNYYPSEWDGNWPHMGKLGPKNIRLLGEFWQVKAIIEEFKTDNNYAPLNDMSDNESRRRGQKGMNILSKGTPN